MHTFRLQEVTAPETFPFEDHAVPVQEGDGTYIHVYPGNRELPGQPFSNSGVPPTTATPNGTLNQTLHASTQTASDAQPYTPVDRSSQTAEVSTPVTTSLVPTRVETQPGEDHTLHQQSGQALPSNGLCFATATSNQTPPHASTSIANGTQRPDPPIGESSHQTAITPVEASSKAIGDIVTPSPVLSTNQVRTSPDGSDL